MGNCNWFRDSRAVTSNANFSSSSTNFGSEQNTQASVVDLAMPGVLPVLNKKAVEMAIMFGLSVA